MKKNNEHVNEVTFRATGLSLGKTIEIKDSWEPSQKKMAQAYNQALEVFPGVAQTIYGNYTIFVHPESGEAYWFNHKLYLATYELNKLTLTKKVKRSTSLVVYENGVFKPTEGGFLLNGYSKAGGKNQYNCIKLGNKQQGHFIPRIHQLVIVMCFGSDMAINALGQKGRLFDINHIDGNPKNCRLDNLEIGTQSHNKAHYEMYLRERPLLVFRNGEVVFAEWYLRNIEGEHLGS
ncbi:HNH endonuclease [Paenibacillus sp. 1_12]|uniref:HNH endonuclease n=1 Tax=Paenibacillus sp. 1_12 TaxID=1566278 RepID=UPI0008E084EE|nr:HNH endonuclease [Paenibacillus sp. 1_12]SFM05097.1 HNH endonuclease [Paenibacillus sp. 1_12]